ncbi:MAG: succinylglutamate desuccinylase/aspartoacylase family protein [Pseudolabrys sp.]|nr:succinylglutamate desuccinylase/aspartoacylase family protein [Pseudolabrys sp.]
MSAVFEFEGLSVPPGAMQRTRVPFMQLADGTAVSMPVMVMNGARPGPRLYIGAGIHGDEVNSIALVARALQQVDVQQLAGSIVCVPVQHPPSLYSDHRLPLAQFLKSPLDQAPADAWTCFPGQADGNLAQVVAATLFRMIRKCDFALDIHTPTRGGRYVPIAILPHAGIGPAAQVAEEMGRALGTGWVMRGDRGMYVSDGILCVEATKAGIPALTFEIGEGGRLEEGSVATGAACVLNLLRHFKMIDGTIEVPAVTHVMRDFLGLRASRGGLLITEVKLGQAVKQGDLLCRVIDIFGDEVERFVAPVDGLFVRATTLSTVTTGERVATLGLL